VLTRVGLATRFVAVEMMMITSVVMLVMMVKAENGCRAKLANGPGVVG